MSKNIDFYYFSPTGGTEKIGIYLAKSISECVVEHNLADKNAPVENPKNEFSVIAVPVFGGRIPAFIAEKLKSIKASGKKAATVAVYGNRAYEDTLLELNNILNESGFCVIASGAFVAQHSMYPELAAGRPDEKDFEDLSCFGKKILEKLESGSEDQIKVPGNYPYKPEFSAPATPISTEACCLCKKCIAICPTDAICISENKLIKTDIAKCALCMACVKTCPTHARILPPPMSKKIRQMLAKFKDIRRKNETYI